jgi:hypothetical protein
MIPYFQFVYVEQSPGSSTEFAAQLGRGPHQVPVILTDRAAIKFHSVINEALKL